MTCPSNAHRRVVVLCIFFVLFAVFATGIAQARTLKVAHDYSDGFRELRHRMLGVMARELEAQRVGLTLKIYPNGTLFSGPSLWSALQNETLEIAMFPLDQFGEVEADFASASRPGLAADLEGAFQLGSTGLMERVDAALERHGLRTLVRVWLPGALVSKDGTCAARPEDLVGVSTYYSATGVSRAVRTRYPEAAVASSPLTADVQAVTEADLLEGARFSVKSGDCVLIPSAHAPWYEYVPVVISASAWQSLGDEERVALERAAAAAESYVKLSLSRAMDAPLDRAAVIKRSGVRVLIFTPEDITAWHDTGRAIKEEREP